MPKKKKPRTWESPRPKTFAKLTPTLYFLPPNASSIKISCPECKASFQPNWQEKNYSLQTIPSQANKELEFVPLLVHFTCPNNTCNQRVSLRTPVTNRNGALNTFIDEAYRQDEELKWRLANYSSVSVGPNTQNQLEKMWAELKKSLYEKNIIGDLSIHVTSIKDERGNKRCKQVLAAACDWVKAVQQKLGDHALLFTSSCAVADYIVPQKEIQRRAFEGYFTTTQYRFGESGVAHQM